MTAPHPSASAAGAAPRSLVEGGVYDTSSARERSSASTSSAVL